MEFLLIYIAYFLKLFLTLFLKPFAVMFTVTWCNLKQTLHLRYPTMENCKLEDCRIDFAETVLNKYHWFSAMTVISDISYSMKGGPVNILCNYHILYILGWSSNRIFHLSSLHYFSNADRAKTSSPARHLESSSSQGNRTADSEQICKFILKGLFRCSACFWVHYSLKSSAASHFILLLPPGWLTFRSWQKNWSKLI